MIELNNLKGKNVHIILKNNFEYNGIVVDIDDRGSGLVFIEIKDKFNKRVIFASGEIKFLEEKR